MAKFCTNCGTSLDDAATFCTSCGTPLDADNTAAPEAANNGPDFKAKINEVVNNFKNMDPEKKQKITKYGIFGGAGLVGLIVLIVVICVIVGNTGYKGLVKDAINAIKNTDGEAYVDMMSEYVLYERPEYLADQRDQDFDRDDKRDDMIESCEEYFLNVCDKYFNKKCGRDYSLSYEIVEAYELADYEYKDLYEEFDIPGETEDDDPELAAKDYWEKVMTVEVELTGKKDAKSKTIDITFVIAKEENGWKIISQECDALASFYY
ncbi:MAG: zinc ribbon domain-containing protein [Clostridia bacterium]|nr:zinc ribbon domain-containing protein [Clostridia bacterium]